MITYRINKANHNKINYNYIIIIDNSESIFIIFDRLMQNIKHFS